MIATTLFALSALIGAPALGLSAAGPLRAERSLPANVQRACPRPTDPERAACLTLVRTDVVASRPDSGYSPRDLRDAYALPSATNGVGQTIGIVDAYDDPNAERDLAVYRHTFGLTACPSANGCLRKLNQRGESRNYPAADAGWSIEISLDLDMVSAICPNCHILLVEADDNEGDNLAASVDLAVQLGANVVSNSYGGSGEGPTGGYDHPGTILVASAGDAGYGTLWPAEYPTVVAAGGTTLRRRHDKRGWGEVGWVGSGSGCTTFPKPAWQTDRHCAFRTENDVAATADPQFGVAAYDTYFGVGWYVLGGTSVASPLIASAYALAGNAAQLNYGESLYADPAGFHDVTFGRNGICKPAYLCEAGRGYDGPTGNGTPNGIGAF